MAMVGAEKRLLLWWLLLVVLTLVSLEGAGELGRWASAAVLVIAFAKVRIVVREFMEVRSAPLLLRLGLELWGAAVCGALIFLMY